MIIKKQKIILNDAANDHLSRILEYSIFNEYVNYTNTRLKFYKQRTQLKKTIKYNSLIPSKQRHMLELLNFEDISNFKSLPIFLTSFAYEFFFVTMPKVESNSNTFDKLFENEKPFYPESEILKSIDDIKFSFSKLKKGFSLLFLPYALAISQNDFTFYENYYSATSKKSYSLNSIKRWNTSLKGEGFQTPKKLMSMYGLTISEDSFSKSTYDDETCLNTFFVILFSDLAKKIITQNKYDFSKNLNIPFAGSVNGQIKNPLLHFMLMSFMPKVIQEISNFLNPKNTSGLGFKIYQMQEAIFSEAIISKRNVSYTDIGIENKIKFSNIYTSSEFNKWESWINLKILSCKEYNQWLNNRNLSSYYDMFSHTVTTDDLQNNIICDVRTNKF